MTFTAFNPAAYKSLLAFNFVQDIKAALRVGQGIASLLVTRIIAEARELGLTELYLWTPSSESLYARHGWKVFERPSYHGLQICIMHRDLRANEAVLGNAATTRLPDVECLGRAAPEPGY